MKLQCHSFITYMYTYTNVMVWVEIYPPYCANEMIYINMAAGIYQQPPILYEHMRLYCTEKEQTALYGNARMQFFVLSWGLMFAGGGFRCIFCLNLLGKIIWNFQGGREVRTPEPLPLDPRKWQVTVHQWLNTSFIFTGLKIYWYSKYHLQHHLSRN